MRSERFNTVCAVCTEYIYTHTRAHLQGPVGVATQTGPHRRTPQSHVRSHSFVRAYSLSHPERGSVMRRLVEASSLQPLQ